MSKNIEHVQHLKSNVVINGGPKLPNPSALTEGEIAVNYAEGYETLSIKNSSGEVKSFSSDEYYTEKKLGSAFTGANSAVTVTEAINEATSGKLDTSAFETYSGAVNTTIENKVDKVNGKELSTNDFTDSYKNKLDSIASGANVNVNADWNASSGDAEILNKPTLGTAAAKSVSNGITNTDSLIESKHIYSGVGATIAYDSSSKYIQLKSTSGNVLSSFDASDFIKDGMIESVSAVTSGGTTVLVIKWNTDAGIEETIIDIGDIFEADNYYAKSETSGKTELSTAFGNKVDNSTYTAYTAATATAIGGKLAISDFNTYSGTVDTAIGTKAAQSDLNTLSGTVTAHTANTTVHVTSGDKETWNTVTSKTDNTAFTAHTASTVHMSTTEKTNLDSLATNIAAISGITSTKVSNWDASYGKTSGITATTAAINSLTGSVGSMAFQNTGSYSSATQVNTALGNKVDKVDGKGLSTNDYTTDEKNKLSGIESGAEVNQNAFSNIKVGSTTVAADGKTDTLEISGSGIVTITADATNDKITISASNAVTSVAGKTGAVTLAKGDVGLGNVDNTADTNKTVKAATSAQTADLAKAVALSGVTNADDLKAIEALTGNSGLLKKTAANTWALDTTSYATNASLTSHTASTVHMTTTEKTNLDSLATNIAAISGITSTKVSNWDTAATNNHTHSNKTYLDGITGSVGTMAYQNTSSYSSATQVNTALSGKQASGSYLSGNTKYAGSSTQGGAATSAEKLTNTSAIGSATQPVFFTANGVPSAITYTIEKSVPSNAVFTDTNTKVTAVGNHYVPTATSADTKTANASSTSELSWGSAVVTGVTLSGDAKGHITSVTVASGKLKTPVTGVTLASGTDNGTVKLTVNGSATDNIAVKGLGTAAYQNITTTAPSSSSDDTTLPTSKAVWTAVSNGIAANDAMVYKTTINGGSTGAYGALTPAANKGWTYKVSTAGKIDGVAVEIGDMLICNTDNTAAATSGNYTTIVANWDFIQTNIDGAVTGPSSSTDKHVAIFDGTTGKVIKDSTYTIEKSVPSNAVFTDTNTKVTAVGNHYTPTSSTTKSAAASGGNALAWGASIISGVTLNVDAAGHVTNVSVSSAKLPATPVTGVTLASGTNNGTIKLTVNGSATDNIAVKGLGTAAYKAEGYFAGSGHTHDGTYAKNAFSRIAVNTTNVDADSTGDTFTITAGTFVSLTGDATNDKMTIGVSTGTSSTTLARGDHQSHYWANLQTSSAANYITEPEIKSVKINGSSTNAASTSNCQIQYDTVNKCLKFLFN